MKCPATRGTALALGCVFLCPAPCTSVARERPSLLYMFILAEALPRQRDLHVYVEAYGGRLVSALGRGPTFSKAPLGVDASGLAWAEGTVQGDLAVSLPSDGYNPPPGKTARAAYTIDVQLDGSKVSGSYEGRADGAAVKGAVSGAVAALPSAAGLVRLTLDMINAAKDGPIDKRVWDRRGFVYVTYKAGRPVQAIVHGHGDGRQVNYFEAAVTGSDLRFEAGRMTGTLSVKSTRGRSYVYTLDGVCAGGQVGGTFGKTVDGKAAPGGLFVGAFEAIPAAPGKEALYDIELLGAVAGGRQLHCFLPRKAGAFRAGVGYSGQWNHSYHDVDPAGLMLAGEKLTGELRVTMNPDPYVPEDGKPVACRYTVDARVGEGCVRGTFRGAFGGEPVAGAVLGRFSPLPPVPEPVRYHIKLDDGVNHGAPWFRRVYLSFVATAGKAAGGGMSNNKGGWKGTFQGADVTFDGAAFEATIRGSVDTSRAVKTGQYTFELTGRAVGRELIGRVETWRDGKKTKEGTAFMGSFGPVEEE